MSAAAPGPRTRLTAVGVAAALALVGATSSCSHAYIYRGDDLPEMRGGELWFRAHPGAEPDTYSVEEVSVLRRGQRFFATPTDLELERLGRRDPVPDIEAVKIDVSTSSAVWTDYALVAGGIGAAAGVILVLMIGGVEPQDRGPIMLGVGLGLGIDSMLVGAIVGALATSGVTDLRLDGDPSCRRDEAP